MKTNNRIVCHSFSGAVFAGAVLLISSSVQAQNLFEADGGSGNIYEFTPGGMRSTFASGLVYPIGLAFNSAGDLFEADWGTGHIYEFTPGGVQSTFASGLSGPFGLAFNSAGDLFEADSGSGNIYEFTPGGAQSTFASGLSDPTFFAFQPVPEPSAFALLAVGVTALFVCRYRKSTQDFTWRKFQKLQ